jgi:hypothetical protein
MIGKQIFHYKIIEERGRSEISVVDTTIDTKLQCTLVLESTILNSVRSEMFIALAL